MYRILIVDDEALVRHGITKSLNWNEFNVEMVAEAENGVEALEQVLENVPDIILLDICMPRMDGLEFASIIKKQYPQIKIVIITGFDDFDYARSALRMGVDDYILKPITKEMVEKVICTQLDKIAEERQKQQQIAPQNDSKTTFTQLNALLRQETWATEEISKLCASANLRDENVYFVMIKHYLSGCDLWEGEAEDQLARFAILNIAGELLQNENFGIAFETYKNELAMVIPADSHKRVEEMLTDIYQQLLEFMEIPVDFAVSDRGSLRNLSSMAEQAREALRRVFTFSEQNIIYYSQIKNRQHQECEYPERAERILLENLYRDDHSGSLEQIDSFFQNMKEAGADASQCKSMLLRLFLKISNTIESTEIRIQPDADMPDMLFEPVSVVESFKTLDEAKEWLKNLYIEMSSYVSNMKSRTGQLYFKIAQYIENNYDQSDLNLKKCSEDLFLSSGYISMILKKESGKTFVDYLNEYRIKRAANYLSAPDSKVYEVAMKTGFTHQTYFSSVFKKIMGVSPRQYKEQH
ncbi:MAG: response regulator [Christensenella sp.]|nr:response regulator [Christensenella sp.]